MMPTQSTITIQSATPADDALIAALYQMWRDNDVPVEEIAYSARWCCNPYSMPPSGRPVYSSLGFADNLCGER